MLAHIADERDYKPGWAAYKYKRSSATGRSTGHASLLEPTPEVTCAWVKSRAIAWAKSQEKQKAAANV